MDAEARGWTIPRVILAVTLGGLFALDCYAMYSGWFGWDRGGMHGAHPAVDNWDDRNARGVVLAIPLMAGLLLVVFVWPRVFGRIRSEMSEVRRQWAQYRVGRSWD